MSSSNTAQLYPANFDSSAFQDHKSREFTRMADDSCFTRQKDLSNKKKLKFVTTNHIDLLEAKEKLNFFGIGVRDQLFVPGERIDTYSDLINGKNGQALTQFNVKNGLGQLPMPTTPYRGQLHHGDIAIEDTIRNNIEVKKNSLLPRESQFQNRSFAIFTSSENILEPQAIKSVETPDVGFGLGRNGAPTRFTQKFDTKHYSSSGTMFQPHLTK